MTNWKKKWDLHPRKFREHDFERQVEATVGGQPYSAGQIEAMTERIAAAMDLQPGDVVLDICCGNGLLTSKLATRCTRIVGLDFSEPLLAVARRHHHPPNVKYLFRDVLRLDQLDPTEIGPIDKALMIGALQYFSKGQFEAILDDLFTRDPPRVKMLFLGNVLNRAAKWTMINSARKKIMYAYYLLSRKDALGTFWQQSYMKSVCQRRELDCEFYLGDLACDGVQAKFRFDVKIARRNAL